MKKILLFILSALLLCSSPLAHPGGTDSQGGHYNHSTGEYHFHHGHSAHQHPGGTCRYDPSGSTDWPTGPRAPMKSSSSSGSTSSSVKSQSVTTLSPKPEKKDWYENIVVSPELVAILSVVGLGFAGQICLALLDSLRKHRLEKQRLREERDHVIATYSGLTRTEIALSCGMPRSFCIDESDLPHDKYADEQMDRCTFYVSHYGSAYHNKPFCSRTVLTPVNITKVGPRTPCKRCHPPKIDLKWYNEYMQIRALMKKHGVTPVDEN